MSTQPQDEHVVVIRQRYTHHKSKKDFKKRVTWLHNKPSVALYEYLGDAPTHLPAHGNAKKTTVEYVRTKPEVLEKIEQAVVAERRKPRDIYARMTAHETSVLQPRDSKQVRNVAQRTKAEKEKTGNAADELQHMVDSIHEHAYIQEICVRSGRPPAIICYTKDQISDMKRFTATSTTAQLRSIVGVDRTFNLGPCYVTVTVFKNKAVIRKQTGEHPIFIGPTLFHFDAKQDTYRRFFDTL